MTVCQDIRQPSPQIWICSVYIHCKYPFKSYIYHVPVLLQKCFGYKSDHVNVAIFFSAFYLCPTVSFFLPSPWVSNSLFYCLKISSSLYLSLFPSMSLSFSLFLCLSSPLLLSHNSASQNSSAFRSSSILVSCLWFSSTGSTSRDSPL